jgi:Transglutaminase-like superfamily
MRLFLQGLSQIFRFEYFMARRNFPSLRQKVRNCPKSSGTPDASTIARICRAINLACVWYPKQVLCLQRSAATTCLLRRHGVAASLVIGARQLPFKAHAWVEVEGVVVNDKPYMSEIYGVLDRC